MKHALLYVAALVIGWPLAGLAQTPAPPAKAPPKEAAKAEAPKAEAPKAGPLAPGGNTPPPLTAPITGKVPNFCDQTLGGVQERSDHKLVGTLPGVTVYAVPWADAQDNHEKFWNAVKILIEEQNSQPNKDGVLYTVTTNEVITCDGVTAREASTSQVMQGITPKTMNKFAREALKQSGYVVDRFDKRDAAGLPPWNHGNSPHTARDPLTGEVLPPGQAKKQ